MTPLGQTDRFHSIVFTDLMRSKKSSVSLSTLFIGESTTEQDLLSSF